VTLYLSSLCAGRNKKTAPKADHRWHSRAVCWVFVAFLHNTVLHRVNRFLRCVNTRSSESFSNSLVEVHATKEELNRSSRRLVLKRGFSPWPASRGRAQVFAHLPIKHHE